MSSYTILRLLGIVLILETCNGLINRELSDNGTVEFPSDDPLFLVHGPAESVYWKDIDPGYVLELVFSNVWTGPRATIVYSKDSGGDWEVGEVIQGYHQSPLTVLVHSVEQVAVTVPAVPGYLRMDYRYYETCSHYCEVSVETKSYKIPCEYLQDKYESVCARCRNSGQCSPIVFSPIIETTTEAPTTKAPVTCPDFDPAVITSCNDGLNQGSYCVLQCGDGYHPRSLEAPHLFVQCMEDVDGKGLWSDETEDFCLSMEEITDLCLPRTKDCPYTVTEMLEILEEENISDEDEDNFIPSTRERSLSLFPTEKQRCLRHCGIYRLRTGLLGRYPCGIFRDTTRQQQCMDCRYTGTRCRGNSVAFS